MRPAVLAVAVPLVFGTGLAACRSTPPAGPAPAARAPVAPAPAPPRAAPLDSIGEASDARIDSLGRLAGTFVGEGTGREARLVSTDTTLIAELIRRYRPKTIRRRDLWGSLARAKEIAIPVRAAESDTGAGPVVLFAEAGSPLGQTRIVPTAFVIRAASCPDGRRARAELVVRERSAVDGDPELSGPVLASLRPGPAPPAIDLGNRQVRRVQPRAPGPPLGESLLERTRTLMDSILDDGFRSLGLTRLGGRIELGGLADVDAADVVPYREAPGTVRYAVALRERRLTAGRDTLLASIVVAWDSAGRWHQLLFRPTILDLDRGRPAPYGSLRRTWYWRRLRAVADLAYERDNLWLEQVDATDGSVIQAVVQPVGNVVVAAAGCGGEGRKEAGGGGRRRRG